MYPLDSIPPLTREGYGTMMFWWQFFPILTAGQWLTDFYPMGKTAISSRLNVNTHISWAIVEQWAMIIMWYLILTLPSQNNLSEPLPWQNYLMAWLYTIHYIYRSYLFPYLQPSMTPYHIGVALFALSFQIINGIAIGGWLGGYGPTSPSDWSWDGRGGNGRGQVPIYLGTALWTAGFAANIYHDGILRDIRRQPQDQGKEKTDRRVEKRYEIPKGGLFKYVFFPHYFTEWIEWIGWWIIGGWNCAPARIFLINEISTMLPRALAGRRWYVRRFGEERCKGKKAVVPGLV